MKNGSRKKRKKIRKRITETMRANPVSIGCVTTDKLSSLVLDTVLPRIESLLKGAFGDFRWHFEWVEIPQEDLGNNAILHYLELAHENLLNRGLDFALAVTSRQVELGRHFSTSSLASQGLSSAVIPLQLLSGEGLSVKEALADEDQAVALSMRFKNLFLHLLGILCGLAETDGKGSVMDRMDRLSDMESELFYSEKEVEHLHKEFEAATRPRTEYKLPYASLAFFYARVLFGHPIRVTKMALANRPWKLITKLHKLVFPAVVTVPLALLAEELWHLGVNQTNERLSLICAAIVVGVTVFLVVKQKLLKRMPHKMRSEQVAIFNLASVLSIFFAVTLVMATIFICALILTGGIFPRRVIRTWLEVQQLTFGDYVRVSFFVACIASVVGWLGAGFTESDEFRMMLYTSSRGG